MTDSPDILASLWSGLRSWAESLLVLSPGDAEELGDGDVK
jgi:hypothetical protein